MASFTFTILGIATILVLVSLSAFFSSSESAIFSLPEEGATERESRSDPRFERLAELRDDPHRLLVTILVGNNIVNMAIASITTALLVDVLPAGSAVSLATVIASFLVLIFGEIVPKSYGLGHGKEWALQVATPITVFERVLYPLVLVFDLITRRLSSVLEGDESIETPYLDD